MSSRLAPTVEPSVARPWVARLPFYYGWVNVAVAAVAMSATLPGRTYGLGLVKEPLRADLGISDLRFNVLNGWSIVIGAVCVPVVGRLIDRLGTRLTLALVAGLLGGCVVLMSRAADERELAVALTLVRGLGQGALSVVAIALVGKWFRRRAGVAMGAFTLLLAVGFVAPIFVVEAAVKSAGWRAAWEGVGLALVFGLVPFGLLLARSTPEACGVPPDEPTPDMPAADSMTVWAALATPSFWVYTVAAIRVPEMKPAGVKTVATETSAPGATLRLALGGKPSLAGENAAFRLPPDGARLCVPGGVCSVAVATDDPAAGFRAAKGFYLAQFKGLAGTKPAAKALFAADPTAQVLEGLFDAADRDGDGKLTLAELEAFFDLVERGVGCRVVVTVSDRGRNLFDPIDANGDGRLDGGELLRAGRTLPDEYARDKPLARDAVPAAYRLVAGPGPVGDSFGPVPFGAAAKPAPLAPKVARGPVWFRAQDKNGDGFVSAREFVGPPDLFAKLDVDGDGRISAAEAEAAKP